MSGRKNLVVFYYAYVGATIGESRHLEEHEFLTRQRRAVARFSATARRRVVLRIRDVGTRGEALFTESAAFSRASDEAQRRHCELAIGDVRQLLGCVPRDRIDEVLQALDGCRAIVRDCTTGDHWAALRGQLGYELALLHSQTSVPVCQDGPVPDRGTTSVGRAGAEANRQKAEKNAENLRAFIDAARETLAPGARLAPSHLARLLNEAGIPSTFGRRWSYNAAKNLLVRLEHRRSADNHAPEAD